MPRLIHLNGPSGVGKSTLAQRFTEDHPGTLNLDADRVATMIGGWSRDFAAVLAPARALAAAMAEAHLRTGRDVVMPQLITSHEQSALFEGVASRTGAGFVEIALMVEPQEQITRFFSRSGGAEHEQHITQRIADRGGETVLRRIHRHFAEYHSERPHARSVQTQGRSPDDTYAALLEAIR